MEVVHDEGISQGGIGERLGEGMELVVLLSKAISPIPTDGKVLESRGNGMEWGGGACRWVD